MLARMVAAPLILLAASPALAEDRPPSADERTAIERALKAAGYVSWEDIELDDGRWEVDNARTRDGRKFDLKLRPSDLRIVVRERDRD